MSISYPLIYSKYVVLLAVVAAQFPAHIQSYIQSYSRLENLFVVAAVQRNDTILLTHLINTTSERTPLAAMAAAAGDNLPLLVWLADHGFPIEPSAMWISLWMADLKTINWLAARGLRVKPSTTWVMTQRPEVKAWLSQHGYGAEPNNIIASAEVARAIIGGIVKEGGIHRAHVFYNML